MAPRVRTKDPKRPKGRGFFYPGEVVGILKLEGIDYRQLRELFRIVREQGCTSAPAGRKWARFTFRDLVALKTALRLAGGEEALAKGRRLRLKDVEHICNRLRNDLGLSQPLAEIAFRRRGRTIIAQAEGIVFEPANGQMILVEVEAALEQYLNEHPVRLEEGEVLRAKLKQEAQDLREYAGTRRSESRIEVSFR